MTLMLTILGVHKAFPQDSFGICGISFTTQTRMNSALPTETHAGRRPAAAPTMCKCTTCRSRSTAASRSLLLPISSWGKACAVTAATAQSERPPTHPSDPSFASSFNPVPAPPRTTGHNPATINRRTGVDGAILTTWKRVKRSATTRTLQVARRSSTRRVGRTPGMNPEPPRATDGLKKIQQYRISLLVASTSTIIS